jgi:Amt family ammonium transporter
MLMTPAVGFFYGGLVRRKNLISTIVQTLTIFALVSLVWALWGYSEAFAPSVNGVIGDLSKVGLNGVGAAPLGNQVIPELEYFAFQLKFAAITPALIIGAFAERIRFKALIIFTVAWATFIYAPVAHWVWGGGWLQSLGVEDFAGGLVVHLTAGVSALTAAVVLGRRKGIERADEVRPNNIPFVILGAAMLWFGWFGFNGGSAVASNQYAALAFANTFLAPGGCMVVWSLVDLMRTGKVTAMGVATAIVVGLVVITPASGFVPPLWGLVMGGLGAIPSYCVIVWRARTRVDESLDVFAGHAVGGATGAILTGVFAVKAWNGVQDGLIAGNPHQVLVQVIAVACAAAYSFGGTFALLKLVGAVTSLRATEHEEALGMDPSMHGEEAYTTGEGAILVPHEAPPVPALAPAGAEA